MSESLGSPVSRLIDRNAAFLVDGRGFGIFIAAVIVLLAGLRAFGYPGATTDDAEQLYFSQVLRLGYDAANPPLYTWLVIAAQQVLGVTIASVVLVKFALFGGAFYFLFQAARQLLEDERLAVLAALAPFACYYVAWDAVLGYSHTVLVTLFYGATMWALLRLDERGGVADYLPFGVIVGLGGLAKYIFFLFLGALVVAALFDRSMRRRLFDGRILLTIAIGGAIFYPHFLWLLDHRETLAATAQARFETEAGVGLVQGALRGLGGALGAAIGFLSPLWLIALVVYRHAIVSRFRDPGSTGRHQRFLAAYFLVLALALTVAIPLFGVTKVRTHYMFVLVFAPVLFFQWLGPRAAELRTRRLFAACLSAIAILVVGGMAAKYVSEPLRCKRCQLLVPFDDVAREVRAGGFTGGTIFAYYFPHDLAGNLRPHFPKTRIVSTKFPAVAPPAGKGSGQCLLIWFPRPMGVMDGNGMGKQANRLLGTAFPFPLDRPVKSITVTLDRTGGRQARIEYVLFDPGVGNCR